jgi:hypothetical protein
MDAFEKEGLLLELLDERVKLARLWADVGSRPEKTVEDSKRLFEAETAWKKLYKRFVAEVIEDAHRAVAVRSSDVP